MKRHSDRIGAGILEVADSSCTVVLVPVYSSALVPDTVRSRVKESLIVASDDK